MRFCNHHEISAHLEIVDAIKDRTENVIGDRALLFRIQPALEFFAPRCPACADVLKRKKRPGLTEWFCACGWRTKECA